MKTIVRGIIVLIILIIAKWAFFLLLPMKYASVIVPLLQIGTRIFVLAYLLWFFWPYIKCGINYLVNHREN